MIAKKHLILIAVGACVLGLVGIASQGRQVERTVTSTFHGTTIVDLTDGSFVTMAAGQATHIGKIDMYTYGRMDPSTLTPLCVKAVMTAANGDQLWAEGVGDHAEYTGGTGRFEGASGRTTWESDLEDLESKLDGETITLILTYNYSMGSTLTY